MIKYVLIGLFCVICLSVVTKIVRKKSKLKKDLNKKGEKNNLPDDMYTLY